MSDEQPAQATPLRSVVERTVSSPPDDPRTQVNDLPARLTK